MCKQQYMSAFSLHSCFQVSAREVALVAVAETIDNVASDLDEEKTKNLSLLGRPSLCHSIAQASGTSLSSPASTMSSSAKPPPHYLTVFDATQLAKEKNIFSRRARKGKNDAVVTYVELMVNMARSCLNNGPFSVEDKVRTPVHIDDKRFYFSVRPYYWRQEDLPPDILAKVEALDPAYPLWKMIPQWKPSDPKYLHRDGIRCPGSVIGGPNSDYTDRSTLWYLMDNVTTLALAWYFTDDVAFAKHASDLVRVFFDEDTGVYPTLEYSQDGDRTGLIDWKDFYYFLDALTLLELSGEFRERDVRHMEKWCRQLTVWYMSSTQGHQEGRSLNNHGLYFDIAVLAVSIYTRDTITQDLTRSRLYYRLKQPAPTGHYAADGEPLNEVDRPTAMHYVTFTLVGWVHAAQLLEGLRVHTELPGAMESLWESLHPADTEHTLSATPATAHVAVPILLKATRWLVKYLPTSAQAYHQYTEPVPGMEVSFPFSQTDAFAFDRMRDIVHTAVQYYGVDQVFLDPSSDQATTFFSISPYSTDMISIFQYSSVNPDSGTRAWAGLGVYDHLSKS